MVTREPYVTTHAVIRYLQRERGIDLRAIQREMAAAGVHGRDVENEEKMLAFMEQKYRIVANQIRAALLTPTVITAIKAGVFRIRWNHLTLVIKGFAVVTVLDKNQSKTMYGKSKIKARGRRQPPDDRLSD
jgi:hypothetical protein